MLDLVTLLAPKVMADSGGTAKPHALFVAAPFQGHFTPSVNLALNLAAKGFVVTFATTEAFNHQRLASGAGSCDDVFADARYKGLDIRCELISDGLPLSLDRTLHTDQFSDALFFLFSGHVEELVRKLLLGDPPIDVLIADTYFVWPSTLSKKFGLPYVSFWTEPALVFSLCYHIPLLVENGHFGPPNERRNDTITYIPGLPEIEPEDLVSFFQAPLKAPRVIRMITKAFEDVKGADFVLCNTVQELEADAIAALQQERGPFYAVGPIMHPDGFTGDGAATTTSAWPESNCSSWLDSMPPGSVLYVSFGSFASVAVSKRDMEEIAYGVLNSKANFLWVLPQVIKADDDPLLPDGFIEASGSRGLVVPWCRQKEVLQHPAVGGFLTHCGWNSVLESMWCGVPMLCFPVVADQPTNRRLVVEDLRIGVDVGEAGEVKREELARRIDGLMGEEVGVEVKREMEKVKETMRSALNRHGSSCENLDQFTVDLLKRLSQERNKVHYSVIIT